MTNMNDGLRRALTDKNFTQQHRNLVQTAVESHHKSLYPHSAHNRMIASRSSLIYRSMYAFQAKFNHIIIETGNANEWSYLEQKLHSIDAEVELITYRRSKLNYTFIFKINGVWAMVTVPETQINRDNGEKAILSKETVLSVFKPLEAGNTSTDVKILFTKTTFQKLKEQEEESEEMKTK